MAVLSVFFLSFLSYVVTAHALVPQDGASYSREPTHYNYSLHILNSHMVLDSSAGSVRIWHPKDNPALREEGACIAHISLESRVLTFPAYFGTNNVLYVLHGSGRIGVVHKTGTSEKDLKEGDIYALGAGQVAYLISTNSTVLFQAYVLLKAPLHKRLDERIYQPFFLAGGREPKGILGAFDEEILSQSFKVRKDDVDILTWQKSGPFIRLPEGHPLLKPSPISLSTWFTSWLKYGADDDDDVPEPYNILEEDHDVDSDSGWSTVIHAKKFGLLKKVDLGAFAVSLRPAAQIAPHWNSHTTEIVIVTRGSGWFEVAHPNGSAILSKALKKGDIFVVPRFHPVVEQGSRADVLEFVGFTTSATSKPPSFLAGSNSVLRGFKGSVLAAIFDAPKDRIKDFLNAQDEAVIISPNVTRRGNPAKKLIDWFGNALLADAYM